jgi:uncharacterized Zn-finger protein
MPKAPRERNHICTELKKDGTVCTVRCGAELNLIYHVRTHTGERPEICHEIKKDGNECRLRFTTPSGLKRHIKTHIGEKPEICHELKDNGEICGLGFAYSSGLKQHIDAIHKKLQDHVCIHIFQDGPEKGQKCGDRFSTKGSLERHINSQIHIRTHAGEKPEICQELKDNGEVCGIEFAQRSGLNTHIKGEHKKLKEHVCTYVFEDGSRTGQICGDRFAQKVNMERHINSIHTKLKNIVCTHVFEDGTRKGEKCGERFARVDGRDQHVMHNHTPKTSPEYIEYRENVNKRRRERWVTDIEYRFTALMRCLFYQFMANNGGKTETTSRTQVVLGCTFEEAVDFLHNNSRGYTLSTPGIQIDHIRPVASFKNKAGDPVEQHRCMNINNLQLLTGPENLAKSDVYDPVAYALTDASKAIEKLVPTWMALYHGVESV